MAENETADAEGDVKRQPKEFSSRNYVELRGMVRVDREYLVGRGLRGREGAETQ